MKETNFSENQFRSWKPRPPSAKLKERIFTRAVPEPGITLVIRWLVPVTACALLAIATLKQPNGIPSGSPGGGPMFATITNSQARFSCLAGDSASARNSSVSVTFDWTNRSDSTSSIGSFLPGQVN